MSTSTHNLGSLASSVAYRDTYPVYTRVQMTNGTDVFTAGDTSGRTLYVESVFASQTAAELALATVFGAEYQPFDAYDCLIDPAAELGDGVSLDGMSNGGIYAEAATFGLMYHARISAPGDAGSIEHDYEVRTSEDSQIAHINASINGSGGIKSSVSSLKSSTDDLHTVSRQLVAKVGETESALKLQATEIDGMKIAEARIETKADEANAGLDLKASKQSVIDLDGRVVTVETASAKLSAEIFDSSGNSKVASKVELNSKLDSDGYANASAVMSASAGSAVASIEAIASESSGGSKSLVQILSDSVNLNNIAYVNSGQGGQSDGLGVRGSIVSSGNAVIGGDLSLPSSDSAINIGYDAYTPTKIAFARDPETKALLDDFYVLGR